MLDSDLEHKLTYDKYLKVDELLSLQEEQSDPVHHDEMLFIVIHQAYELWFKQILHELSGVVKNIRKNSLFPVLKSLDRIITIQKVIIKQVDIIETLSPVEFAGFRDHLNPASGFQSHQFRLVEFFCGLKNDEYLKYHKHVPHIYKMLEDQLATPSLYDEVLGFLSRQGFDIPDDILTRDVKKQYQSNDAVLEVIKKVYFNTEDHKELYYLFEKLVEIDENFQIWRFRHVKMVQRTIGMKMGTGGSPGAQYLMTTLSKTFFPELWDVRSLIGNY
jgi:tryptophan 2,3-dioxygenase